MNVGDPMLLVIVVFACFGVAWFITFAYWIFKTTRDDIEFSDERQRIDAITELNARRKHG